MTPAGSALTRGFSLWQPNGYGPRPLKPSWAISRKSIPGEARRLHLVIMPIVGRDHAEDSHRGANAASCLSVADLSRHRGHIPRATRAEVSAGRVFDTTSAAADNDLDDVARARSSEFAARRAFRSLEKAELDRLAEIDAARVAGVKTVVPTATELPLAAGQLAPALPEVSREESEVRTFASARERLQGSAHRGCHSAYLVERAFERQTRGACGAATPRSPALVTARFSLNRTRRCL